MSTADYMSKRDRQDLRDAGPLKQARLLRLAGMPVYLIDRDDEVSADIKQRVLRCMQATASLTASVGAP